VADRFEGDLEDIFDLQDQVTASVVGAIAPRLEQAEIERSNRKRTENLDAYDYYLRGLAAFNHGPKKPTTRLKHYSTRLLNLIRSSLPPMEWLFGVTRKEKLAGG
jgi:hypothetical protein